MAVLTSMAYSTQILEQNLNLISDYKFGFYMKIPEREMFIGQIWGTLLGPFVNYGVMRLLLDHEAPAIRGDVTSTRWAGVSTINMYSSSIIWGLIGPRKIFSKDSIYSWVYYGFLVGAGATAVVWAVSRRLKGRDLEQIFNPSVFFAGMLMFPKHPMSNFMTSALVAVFFVSVPNCVQSSVAKSSRTDGLHVSVSPCLVSKVQLPARRGFGLRHSADDSSGKLPSRLFVGR